MAVFYLDPEDGNDALDGTTFANRKKTILSGTTPMANGDELRVIASPVVNLGVCQWTDNSRNITIPAGLVKVIDDANGGFTPTANVTATTNTVRKSGATSAELTIATAFTTGKIAHKALGSALDLSAFQFVAFWIFCNTTAPPLGSLELRLCSDATGDVPVATIPCDDGVTTVVNAGWSFVSKDFGAALPSGINSISLYANSDPGTVTLRLNNIVASKGKNAADHVSLLSAVGKQTAGEPEWYPLQSLTDTSVSIGASQSSAEALNPPRPFRGISESVTTYATRGLAIASTAANRTPVGSGILGTPKRITGGWDRSAMAVQSGISWFTGRGTYASFIEGGVVRNYWSLEKLGMMYFQTAAINNNGAAWNVQFEGVLACLPLVETGADGPSVFDIKQIWGFNGSVGLPPSAVQRTSKTNIGRLHGSPGTGHAYYNNAQWSEDVEVFVGKIDNNAGYGFGSNDYTQRGYLNGTTFLNNALGDVRTTGGQMAQIMCHGCTLGSATPYNHGVTDMASEIILAAQDGDPTRHTRIRRNSILTTDTTVRHTASGIAWKLTLQTALVNDGANPCAFRLADVAVRAGALVTAKCWLRRDNAGLSAGIMVRGNRIAGVVETKQLTAAAINTWEQVTLTFTPTAAGVISIYGFAYGALFSAYFDDLEITQ